MQVAVDWNITAEEYRAHFGKIRASNLLQSYEYGLACEKANRLRPVFGKIVCDGGVEGIFLLLETGALNNLIHGVILDRGPLWLSESEFASEFFFREFAKKFPARPGRRRRIIPEMNYPCNNSVLANTRAYRSLDRPEYLTVRLDLSPDLEKLRAGLRQKWRNGLNRSEKFPFEIEWDESEEFWRALRARYIADRKARGYPGPSVNLLDAIVVEFAKTGNLLIGRALLNSNYCSGMLIFRHGRSATWQVGWTSEEGRRSGAAYRLLWQACLELKGRGTDDFDLGGVNEQDASGVRHFKGGLGGKEIRLAGHFM